MFHLSDIRNESPFLKSVYTLLSPGNSWYKEKIMWNPRLMEMGKGQINGFACSQEGVLPTLNRAVEVDIKNLFLVNKTDKAAISLSSGFRVDGLTFDLSFLPVLVATNEPVVEELREKFPGTYGLWRDCEIFVSDVKPSYCALISLEDCSDYKKNSPPLSPHALPPPPPSLDLPPPSNFNPQPVLVAPIFTQALNRPSVPKRFSEDIRSLYKSRKTMKTRINGHVLLLATSPFETECGVWKEMIMNCSSDSGLVMNFYDEGSGKLSKIFYDKSFSQGKGAWKMNRRRGNKGYFSSSEFEQVFVYWKRRMQNYMPVIGAAAKGDDNNIINIYEGLGNTSKCAEVLNSINSNVFSNVNVDVAKRNGRKKRGKAVNSKKSNSKKKSSSSNSDNTPSKKKKD